MLLCRRPLLFISDALGVVGLVLLGGALWVGVAQPLKTALAAQPRLRAEEAAASEHYEAAVARNRVLADSIRQLEANLQHLTGSHRSETGDFLEFVSDRCAAAGIRLQQVAPQSAIDHAQHRSWDAQLLAAGSFSTFPRLLAEIEAWSPFVQIREVTIIGPPPPTVGECQFKWTVRVNSLLPSRPAQEGSPR